MSNGSVQIKRFLPPAVATLGVVLAAWQGGSSSPRASVSQTTSTPSTEQSEPATTETPHVSVNGQKVQVDPNGKANIDLPGNASAQVEVSGGRTTVTTSNSSDQSTVTTGQDSNLEVTVQGDFTGGRSHSSAHISSSTTDNGSSHSSTSTHVFGTDTHTHIDVTSP
jgi:hypothetical protein